MIEEKQFCLFFNRLQYTNNFEVQISEQNCLIKIMNTTKAHTAKKQTTTKINLITINSDYISERVIL